MNKKGFTLTELLATIAIIAVVSLIGTASIAGIKNKIDENMFDSKVQLALGAARNWGQDNKTSLPTTKKINDLITLKYLENEGTSFTTNEGKDAKNTVIKIYLKNNRVYACLSSNSNMPTTIYNNYKCS